MSQELVHVHMDKQASIQTENQTLTMKRTSRTRDNFPVGVRSQLPRKRVRGVYM